MEKKKNEVTELFSSNTIDIFVNNITTWSLKEIIYQELDLAN